MANYGEGSSSWTWQQDKIFETGLVIYPDGCEGRWAKIAEDIPGFKTPQEVQLHYQLLVDDVAAIEAGNVPLPNYNTDSSARKRKDDDDKNSEWESRKGQPWTEEEHKQFLLGMQEYGKGDWKTIAKDFVKTRSATQVASHAQKHFKRQGRKKNLKRWSIFDITHPTDRHQQQQQHQAPTNQQQQEAPTDQQQQQQEEQATVADPVGIAIEQQMPTFGINEGGNVANVIVHGRPVSPPLSPPASWCLDSDEDNVLSSAYDDECLSQLQPW